MSVPTHGRAGAAGVASSFRARNSLLQRTAARGELELSLVVRRIKNAEVAVLRKKIKKFNVVTGLLLAVVTGASPACCRSEGLRWSDRPSMQAASAP